jgi:prophage antirepressor-like protein
MQREEHDKALEPSTLIQMNFDGHNVAYFLDAQGEPWWPVQAPCIILGYDTRNLTQIMARLDEDEKEQYPLLRSSGMALKQWCVNEDGLYSLILGSHKTEAKPFKRWITHEVLPSIRRTGSYRLTEEEKIDSFLLPGFLPWEKKFHLAFYQEICRVYNQPIPQGKYHSPMCGSFIWGYIYGILPPSVQDAINLRNPLHRQSRYRAKRIHQQLRPERQDDFLRERQIQLLTLLRVCEDGNKEKFKALLEDHDRKVGLQIKITPKIHLRLSTVASNQLVLFEDIR